MAAATPEATVGLTIAAAAMACKMTGLVVPLACAALAIAAAVAEDVTLAFTRPLMTAVLETPAEVIAALIDAMTADEVIQLLMSGIAIAGLVIPDAV